MPEPENLKVEDLSKSVKQAPHSEQATGHGMHCREILFTPRCSPRAREFHGLDRLSVRRTVAELRGVKLAQFSDFGLCRRYMRFTECPSSFFFFSSSFRSAADLANKVVYKSQERHKANSSGGP